VRRLLFALDPIDLDQGWEPQMRRLAEQVRERFAARPPCCRPSPPRP